MCGTRRTCQVVHFKEERAFFFRSVMATIVRVFYCSRKNFKTDRKKIKKNQGAGAQAYAPLPYQTAPKLGFI